MRAPTFPARNLQGLGFRPSLTAFLPMLVVSGLGFREVVLLVVAVACDLACSFRIRSRTIFVGFGTESNEPKIEELVHG